MLAHRLIRLRMAVPRISNNPNPTFPSKSLSRFNTTRRIAKTALRLFSSTVKPEDVRHEGKFRNGVLRQDMDLKDGLPTVVIAGAAGHLGRKFFERLLTTSAADYVDVPLSARPVNAAYDTQGAFPTRFRLILMDILPKPKDLDLDDTNGHEVEYVQCDFTKYEDEWVKKFDGAYTAFLLATKMHFPKVTSEAAYASMLINSNLLEACAAGKVERVVMGSSTDVVRGCMRQKTEKIDADATPNLGDKVEVLGEEVDSTLYAAGKIAGEAQAKAMVESEALDRVIILRIGTSQPLAGLLPKRAEQGQLSVMTEEEANGDVVSGEAFLDNWFQGVHLRDEDLFRVVDACVSPGLDASFSRVIYVNAVSKNPGANLNVDNVDVGYVPPPPEVEQRVHSRI